MTAFNLIGVFVLVTLAVGFVYWPARTEDGPSRSLLFLLRAGVCVGYGIVVLLLATDAAAPAWLTGTDSSPGNPGCLPVIGAELWQTPSYLSEATCATLTNARLGWALLCAIVTTLCLAALTRLRVRADIADRLAPAREKASENEG